MSKILVVDRIENNIAVCENRKSKKMIEIELSKLPQNVKEGTVLKYKRGKFSIDSEKQKEIEERIQEKMNSIWEDD